MTTFKSLRELVSFKGGGTPSKQIAEYWNGGIPWASVKDFTSTSLSETQDFISQEGLRNSSANLIPKGHVIIPTRMSLGKAAINTVDLAINQDLRALVPKVPLDTKFLLHAVLSLKDEIVKKGSGATVKGITQEELYKLEIAFPPLDDQIRIAHLLGKVEDLIAQRKQHLQQLDDLLKSVFLEMFGDPVRNEKGWATSTIERFCEAVVDCPHSTPAYSEVETGHYCVRSSDIVDGYLDLTKTYQVDKRIFEDRIARYCPQPNDIVYSREGGRLGNAARIIGLYKICLGQRIMLFQVNHINAPEFLWALLESASFKAKLQGLIGGGAAPRVNIKDLKKLVVINPTPDLQRSFSKIVLKIDQLRELYKKHLTELESLYGMLSQQAFKGELDLSNVPLPDTNPAEEKVIAAEPLNIHAEQGPNINLPDSDKLPDAFGNAEARAALMTLWLEAYRRQLGNTPFSVQQFFTAAQSRVAELHPDTDFVLGANDYDYIKAWVFDRLGSGVLKQTRNVILENEKRKFGNKINLRVRESKRHETAASENN